MLGEVPSLHAEKSDVDEAAGTLERSTDVSLNDFRSIHLPYCLDQQSDGSYVILNREYKPIGFASKDFVEYGKYPVCVKFKGLTANLAAKVSYSKSKDLDRIYLYNDGCVPTSNA